MRIITTLFFGFILTYSTTAQDWVSVDLNPNGDSYPEGFFQWGSDMLFTADDGTGRKVYKTDGTVGGTIALTGPSFDMGYVFNFEFKEYNGELYFIGDDGVNGRELWKTDGTVAGTQMVADVNPSGSSDPTGLCVAGGMLFFGWVPQGLWMTDGTEVGTVQVQDPNSPEFIPYANDGMVELNGMLIFSGQHSVAGRELYVSDGTAIGTTLLKDIYPGVFASYPAQLTKVPDLNEVFFVASDGTHGEELWKTDGTESGTVLVHDVVQGATGSNPGNLMPYTFTNEFRSSAPQTVPGIMFTADHPTVGNEILFTDGEQSEPSVTVDLNIGLGGSQAQSLSIIHGTVVFSGDNGFDGHEVVALYELGATAGPDSYEVQVSLGNVDVNQGPDASVPSQFTECTPVVPDMVLFKGEQTTWDSNLLGSFGFTSWFGVGTGETRGGGSPNIFVVAPPSATETDPLYGGSFALFNPAKIVISAAYTTIGHELWIYTPEEEPTGIDNDLDEYQVFLSPNPTAGAFEIQLSDSKEILQIDLFDLTGKRITNLSSAAISQASTVRVALPAEIVDGVYLVQLTAESGIVSKKLVLNR